MAIESLGVAGVPAQGQHLFHLGRYTHTPMSIALVTCLDEPNVHHETTARLLRLADTGNSLVINRSPFMTVVVVFVTEGKAEGTSYSGFCMTIIIWPCTAIRVASMLVRHALSRYRTVSKELLARMR